MATYTKLRDGSWGIRAQEPLTAGQAVTVAKRDGTTQTETVDKIVWTGEDGTTLATIQPRRKAASASSARRSHAETKTCWECGLPFTRAHARANDGDWQDSYCGC